MDLLTGATKNDSRGNIINIKLFLIEQWRTMIKNTEAALKKLPVRNKDIASVLGEGRVKYQQNLKLKVFM